MVCATPCSRLYMGEVNPSCCKSMIISMSVRMGVPKCFLGAPDVKTQAYDTAVAIKWKASFDLQWNLMICFSCRIKDWHV